jgi:hypothetical protein
MHTGTRYVWISGGTRRTRALRLVITRDTGRGFSAGVILANRSANPVQPIACLMIGAVFVIVTDRGSTCHSWITLGARRANALSSMRYRSAFRTAAAHDVTGEAGSNAIVVSTGLVVGAVIVCLTFRCRRELRTISKRNPSNEIIIAPQRKRGE